MLSALPLALAIAGVMTLSVQAWAALVQRVKLGQPLVPSLARWPAAWGLADLAVGAALWLVFQVALVGAAQAGGSLELDRPLDEQSLASQLTLITISSLASCATWAGMLGWLALRTGGRLADLGIAGPWRGHLARGTAAFAILVAPVYAIQLVLVNWFPSQHPLIEMLRRDPRFEYFALAAFAATVAAPLFEEFFFRMLLQGWLENLFRPDVTPQELVFGIGRREVVRRRLGETEPDSAPPAAPLPDAIPIEDSEFAAMATEASAAAGANPYSPPAVAVAAGQGNGKAALLTPPLAWVPIVISSAAFAAVHIGHGPDPIPLFVLGLGLGYLYQRTHNLWPGVVAHALFNAFSLGLLWLSLSLL